MNPTPEQLRITLAKLEAKGVKQPDLITKNAMPSGRGPNAGGLSGSMKVPEPAKSVTAGRDRHQIADPKYPHVMLIDGDYYKCVCGAESDLDCWDHFIRVHGECLPRSHSKLEDHFYELWLACGGPPLCREHRIFGERKWRADFAHLTSQTIIEVDGGVWVPGGHNMQGHVRDCERDLECILNGWRVVRLVPSMITVSNIERLIAFVKGAI